MEIEKIYVRMIDGTESLVPVNARWVRGFVYEVLDDPEYHDPDPSVLFEFYPGDIIEVDATRDMDLDYAFEARKLIESSKHADREYYRFLFLGTLRMLPISETTRLQYQSVLARIEAEEKDGRFFYRGVRESFACLDRLRLRK